MANIGSNAEINKILVRVQGSNPSGDPTTGYAWLFIKSDGLYLELPGGTVVGPLSASGSPGAHATSHQNGGGDEISVDGLSGVLADRQDANKLQGRDIQDVNPTNGQRLIWNATNSRWEPTTVSTELANHDHSGDTGDGGTFDAANLTSGAATDGYVLTADGAGGAAWEAAAGGSSLTVKEQDGSPTVSNVTEIRVTNGKLTDNGSGAVSLDLGGGTSIYSIWDPMAPPASPHSADDEFADNSLTGWTTWDRGSKNPTIAEGDYRLKISHANQSYWYGVGIYKAITSGSDLTFWTRLRSTGQGALHFWAFALFEDATTDAGDIVTWGFYGDGSGPNLAVHQWPSYSSDPTSKSSLGISGARVMDWYLRIRKVSGDSSWRFEYSLGGRTWYQQYSYTSFPFTPQHIGFFMGSRIGSGLTLDGYADFYRVTTSSDFNQVLAGRLVTH